MTTVAAAMVTGTMTTVAAAMVTGAMAIADIITVGVTSVIAGLSGHTTIVCASAADLFLRGRPGAGRAPIRRRQEA